MKRYAVMANADTRLNTYNSKTEAQAYIDACASYQASQGRSPAPGYIATWDEAEGRYA